ncbi:hypothetical protein MBLNU230_g1603t1 [Neophaeotheca triangularis]
MSSFNNGRRAPNVSNYLANLNALPQTQPMSTQNEFGLPADDGLEFLTNAEFFDFDGFNQDDSFISAPQQQPQQRLQGVQSMGGDGMGMNGQFQFSDLAYQGNIPATGAPQMAPAPVNNIQQAPFPAQPQQQPQPQVQAQQGMHYSTPPGQASSIGSKRKASSPEEFEEGSRVAAEEDKRRRNTAASARFRVKKKQREQALESQAREMSEKVKMLEGKVNQLEMENKWLKGLITEKGDAKAPEVEGKAGEKVVPRSIDEGKEGVGTEVAKVDAEEA